MAPKASDGPNKRKLFEEQALPHLDALYSAALRLLRDRDKAEDLVQDTMMRAYRFFDRFTPGTNCKAWLFTILYNNFRSGYRRMTRQQPAASEADFERALDAESMRADPAAYDPETLLVNKLTGRQIEAALEGLPEEFRAALFLVDVQQLNYHEVAATLEVPIGTVKSRVSRGRGLMRAALRKLGRG